MLKRALTTRYSTLFVSLLLLIVLLTISVDAQAASLLTLILFTQLMASGVYVAADKKRDIVIAVALGTILGFMPAPFLDSLLVGVIFARFRQINRSALLAARIVWNDLIVVP